MNVFCGNPDLLKKQYVPQDSRSSLIRESIIISKEDYENINNPILLTCDLMRPFLPFRRRAAKENTDDNPMEVR